MSFSVEQLEQILAAVKTNNIQNLYLEDGDFILDVTGSTPAPIVGFPTPIPAPTPYLTTTEAIPAPSSDKTISSPIVGTFYESSAPDQPPYVTIGSKVTRGDILFIIESMKLMNEVVAEESGIITAVLVKNQDPVEYGQPILTIE